MQNPNWFDEKYDSMFAAPTTAERMLADIAKDKRVVDAVRTALADHDANAKKPGRSGESRTQAVRTAIVEVLQAQA